MGNRRKLEITLDVPACLTFYSALPEGWDEMTPEEQQQEISDEIEHIKYNYVLGEGRVVEVPER